jgi:hypothetical protein
VKVPQQTRDAVIARDASRCARCNRGVANVPSSVQHRKPRGMGGTSDVRSYDMRNLVLMCGTGTTGCHGDGESFRALAYDTGWLVRSYDDLDTPLISKDGRRITLTSDGDRWDEIDAASLLAAAAMV